MKIICTGSEGFIGSHIMEQGRLLGYEMVGCDIVGIPNVKCPAHQVGLIGSDRVIHAAGILGTKELLDAPVGAVDFNITETVQLLDNCRKNEVPLTYITLGNTWLNPYSITKNCAAEFVRMYHAVHGLPTQVATTYNVFGPHQKWKPVRKIVPEFMTRLLAGLPVQINGVGDQWVDMVYAPDVARAILLDTGTGDAQYGSGVGRYVMDVAKDCAKALGVEFKAEHLPPRQGETGPAAVAEYARPHQMPYEEALKHTADWYRENFKL